jgi:hypothetical protein
MDEPFLNCPLWQRFAWIAEIWTTSVLVLLALSGLCGCGWWDESMLGDL